MNESKMSFSITVPVYFESFPFSPPAVRLLVQNSIKKETGIDIPEDKITGTCIADFGVYLIPIKFGSDEIVCKLWVVKYEPRVPVDSANIEMPLPAPTCQCTVQNIECKNMLLLYARRGCPVHGKYWRA